MQNQRFKEIGVALAAAGAICAAAVAGVLMTWNQHISRETLQAVPPTSSLDMPFIVKEQHVTDWSGLIGGATPDAKKVRTVVVHPDVGK